MHKLKARLVALACLAVLPMAEAHHSFAMFDLGKTVTVEGTVKSFHYTNPHIWLVVTVEDAHTRQAVDWAIEGGSPNNLTRAGWNRTLIKAGDKAAVTVHPLRSGAPGGSLMGVQVGKLKLGT